MTESLLREWGEHDVLTLTINRPDRRNAVDPDVLAELADALRADGERARAIVLRGAGTEAFSAGYDLGRLTGSIEDLEADRFIGDAATALRNSPAPVIARLQGHCHGAGVELALNCDLRIASNLRLSVPSIGLGVVYRYPFVARLVQMCGIARASDLLLGMLELDSETAYEWGLVTEVVAAEELDRRVYELAENLARAPRPAVEGTKASLNLLDRRMVTGEDLAQAHEMRTRAASSPERKAAVERRKQNLKGR
jgi:enoyl-CoA hydratase/carnithine racemase